MADLTPASAPRQMTASGFAGLFGLFAGLCAIFAVCVTLIDWHDEATQARWPLVSAVVDRTEVVASQRTSSGGGGTLWNLRARVRYEVNGAALTATLTSRTAFSESEADTLQAWAAEHPKGSQVEIHYDASRQDRAGFASADLSSVAGRTRTDLIIAAVAAIACVLLLALTRVLRVRELRAGPVAGGAQQGGRVLAFLVAALGLAMTGAAIHGSIHADPFVMDSLIGVPMGLMFLFAGILVGLPPQYYRLRNVLTALLITCFALTFDWVAFGPGERNFTGSINGFGFIPGEYVGRTAFGLFAILLDVLAVAMWSGRFRQGPGSAASARQGGQTINPADSTI